MNFPRKFLEKEKLQKIDYSPLTSHLLIDEAFKVILEDNVGHHKENKCSYSCRKHKELGVG
jgi:hypothetical protein